MFTVIHDINNYSLKLKDFSGDTALVLATPLLELYIGYYKPFTNLFIAFKIPNTTSSKFTYSYWDGLNWITLNVSDESKSFSKDGFIYFDRPNNWARYTVNDVTDYYIKCVPDIDTSLMEIQGISVMLSNDSDLEGIRSNIVSKHNNGNTWLLKTQAAKKFIIQTLRNRGHVKIKNKDSSTQVLSEGAFYSDISEFDLIDPFELRQASIYKTMAMIYLDELSDEAGDKWERQGLRYNDDFKSMLEIFLLKLDENDDGIDDLNDNIFGVSVTLVRD